MNPRVDDRKLEKRKGGNMWNKKGERTGGKGETCEQRKGKERGEKEG